MRLWSIHPKYLDSKGLVALWREGLLAKKVLEGKTRGYKKHPQLIRFLESKYPIISINTYLYFVYREAVRRGFNFDKGKLDVGITEDKIPIKTGQIKYELNHLKNKLKKRSPERANKLDDLGEMELNPIFFAIEGPIEEWEIV